MKENLTFLDKKISAFKSDISHINKHLDQCENQIDRQRLIAQKQYCTDEMMNYIELKEMYAQAV